MNWYNPGPIRVAAETVAGAVPIDDPAALPERLAHRFTSYFDVKAWLDQQGIPYRHEFDSWA